MTGLVPAIHVLTAVTNTWMPGTSPGMTSLWSQRVSNCLRPCRDSASPYSDIGLSEMSQSLPLKVEMNSVFIGV